VKTAMRVRAALEGVNANFTRSSTVKKMRRRREEDEKKTRRRLKENA